MQGKVALCWAGLLRTNPSLVNTWKKNIIDPLKADVFICTRNVFFNPSTDPYNTYLQSENIPDNYFYNNYDHRIKKLEIRDPEIDFYKNRRKELNLPEFCFQEEQTWRNLSYFYSIKRTLELKEEYEKENNIKYDLTILTRPDLECFETPDISNLNENKVYFTGKDTHVTVVFGYGNLISDHFLIGKSENIDLLKDIYDLIPEYNTRIANDGKKLTLSNETLIGYRFLENNIDFGYDPFLHHEVRRY